ncbi:hypothetical protein ANN_27716 [Periplaneta americana]|uniref:Uncharacterized protein n=1 Tax=Periplaneta americana TaxID=6978 RepID=A0ABQ8RV23_PERAM|nr:hypothetical protein ANN_27716 [Periplaneta americana]
MATNARKSVSVFHSGLLRFVNSIVDESEGSDASECEVENELDYNSEHDTESEQDYDSDGVDEGVNQPNGVSLNFYCKDAYKWTATEPNRNRTPAHNIVIKVPTLKGKAKNLGNSCNPSQAWECLFTEDMITEIFVHTNEKISSHRANFSYTTRTELRETNVVELRAFFRVPILQSSFEIKP